MVASKQASAGWVEQIVGILPGCLILASCREGALGPRGPAGRAERVIFGDSTSGRRHSGHHPDIQGHGIAGARLIGLTREA